VSCALLVIGAVLFFSRMAQGRAASTVRSSSQSRSQTSRQGTNRGSEIRRT
jgi:hypothetical protein